jgi:exopolysaccharide biosynthesis polyprenyl glycosylphosphotransferase
MMKAAKKHSPVFLLDMTADILAVAAAYFAAFFIRFSTPLGNILSSLGAQIETSPGGEILDFGSFYFHPHNAARILLHLSVTLCTLNAFVGLYSGRRFLQTTRFTAFKLLKADFIALLFFVSYLYLSRNQFHPRSTFVILMVLHFLFSLLFRKIMVTFLAGVRSKWGVDRHPVLLAGEPGQLDVVEFFLREKEPHGLYPVRRIPIPPGDSPIATARHIVAEAKQCGADTICCCDSRLSLSALMELLDMADTEDLTVKIGSPNLSLLLHEAGIQSDSFQGEPLLHFSPTSDFAPIQRLRRIGSVILSLALIVAASPLFVLVALLVKLSSPGPVFFIQDRVGWDGRRFRMFKFRTMHNDAEQLKEAMEQDAGAGGRALFKIRRDPRVIPVGHFLRKFSLDELPQFFNVLRGDMNLVGPRPLPAADFKHYSEPWHRSRHKGLPGITGLWQVSGRSNLTFEQMCALDIYYLHNASLSLDLSLLFRTGVTILFAEGAY